ncbi:MAG: ATP-binding cassette domain-containing protein [Eubacterium sp.]|jgi:ABC-2 type transport system ATP-binding protein|nr:ATP-binding cassette domain-containing protein [Eubacterium sp.]
MLKIENLSKSYNNKVALSNLNLEMNAPGVYALLGTNGAGKTTAIRVILGMLSRDSGTVIWKDKPFRAINDRVGYLSEDRGLYPKLSVYEQIRYFASLKGLSRNQAEKAIDYWFNRLEIKEYLKKPANLLSKGNQQKMQLAAALISDPELLVLDEPLSGLDPVNSDLFKSVIREEIENKKYIIMSSHQMPTVEEFCEDIVILHKSKTVLQGNLNKIKKSYGRVMLSIKSEGDIMPLVSELNIEMIKQTPGQTDFKIKSEGDGEALLKKIISMGITLIKYELREPSLHEIFLEKAGEC